MKELDKYLFNMGTPKAQYEPDTLFTNEIMRGLKGTAQRTFWSRMWEKMTMKSPYKTAPGIAVLAIIIGLGGLGAGALTNWFSGNPTAKDDGSIMSVDVSSCKDAIYSRIVPNSKPQESLGTEQTDFKNLKFKITGQPHISTADLQKQLLIDCEYAAVETYFAERNVGDITTTGKIKNINGTMVNVEYMFNGTNHEKTIDVSGLTLIQTSQPITQAGLKAGSYVAIAFAHPVSAEAVDQSIVDATDYFAETSQVHAVFITQYDLRDASGTPNKRGIQYETMNIMPLDTYLKHLDR